MKVFLVRFKVSPSIFFIDASPLGKDFVVLNGLNIVVTYTQIPIESDQFDEEILRITKKGLFSINKLSASNRQLDVYTLLNSFLKIYEPIEL